MAFAFIATASVHAVSATGGTVTKPTGTADNDLMFTDIKRSAGSEADPTTVPTGWTLLVKRTGDVNNTYWVYWKLAASEGANYTWTWAGTTRTGITVVTYRDGFNTANPIDVSSNTAYQTSDTILRAAGMTVAAANSPLIFFGNSSGSAARTVTPPTNPTSFAEDVDFHDADSRWGLEVASVVWTGSGATGDIDGILSITTTDKHAFAVALNPAADGGGEPVPVSGATTVRRTLSDLGTRSGARQLHTC